MRVVLHIDKVTLRGVPLSRAQLPTVRAALERELARLFRRSGAAPAMRSIRNDRVVGDSLIYRADRGGPQRLGRQLARAVYSASRVGVRA